MTDEPERRDDSAPADPLARAIYDWLDPVRRDAESASRENQRGLRGTDRDRLRHLIDESGVFLRAKRPTATMPREFQVGPYRTLSSLGAGGFAHVHLAVDERNDRRVALKLLRAELASDPRELERFQREADAARRVHHRGCVSVVDSGIADGQPYLALEIVEGESLDALIRQRRTLGEPLSVDRVLRIGIDLCEALQAIHDEGLVHRDVKPGNVRLTPDGRVVLVDFGLATGEEFVDLTRTGEFIGSLPYAAPEQVLHGARDVGPRADLYSLAATLYECLTAQTVHAGTSAQQLVLSIARDEPLAPQRLNPRIPRELALVLLKALEKSPALRYASAREFANDLIAVRDRRPVAARPRGFLRSFFATVRRHPVMTFSITAIVLGGFTLPLALFLQQRSYTDRLRAERDYAEGQRLAAQSRLAVDQDPGLATLLALESIDRADTLDGRNAVVGALQELHESKTIVGPWQRANSAMITPDERCAILLTREGDLYRVDLETGASNKFASGFVPQSMLVRAGEECWVSRSGTQIARFDLATNSELPSIDLPPAERVQITALGAAANRAIVARGKEVIALADARELRRFGPFSATVRALVLLPDGKRGFAATQSGSIVELDLESGAQSERIAVPPPERIQMALSLDGSKLAIGAEDDIVVLETKAGGSVTHIAPGSSPSSMALDSTGTHLLVSRTLDIPRCYAVDSGRQLYPLLGHSDQIRSCGFLPRTSRILTVGSELDSTLRLYSPRSVLDEDLIHEVGKLMIDVEPCGDGTSGIVYYTDGDYLERIDLRTGRVLWSMSDPRWRTAHVRCFLGYDTFLVRQLNGPGELRKLSDGSWLAALPVDDTDFPVVDEPGGKSYLLGTGRKITRIDASTGQPIEIFQGETDGAIVNLHRCDTVVLGNTRSGKLVRADLATKTLSTFAELPPGSFCAMVQFDPIRKRCLTKEVSEKTFALTYSTRSLADGRLIDSSPPITSHLFNSFGVTPDGRFAVDSLGSTLFLREIDSKVVSTITTGSTITSGAASSDSKLFAMGNKSGVVRVFKLPTLEVMFDLALHRDQVVTTMFDGDGHTLITACDDGQIRRTDLDTLISRARRRLPRSWTAAERALFRISDAP